MCPFMAKSCLKVVVRLVSLHLTTPERIKEGVTMFPNISGGKEPSLKQRQLWIHPFSFFPCSAMPFFSDFQFFPLYAPDLAVVSKEFSAENSCFLGHPFPPCLLLLTPHACRKLFWAPTTIFNLFTAMARCWLLLAGHRPSLFHYPHFKLLWIQKKNDE